MPCDIAPVDTPLALGTHGLITPDLSVFPVPIEALLAPEPAIPASELVSAIEVVVEWVCAVSLAVRLHAAVSFIGVCANADAENAIPIATDVEKMKRDMVPSVVLSFCGLLVPRHLCRRRR